MKIKEIKKELQEVKLLLMQLPDEYRLTRTVGKLGLEHLENVSELLESTISQTRQEVIGEIDHIFIKRMQNYANKPLENRHNAYDELFETSQEVLKFLEDLNKK